MGALRLCEIAYHLQKPSRSIGLLYNGQNVLEQRTISFVPILTAYGPIGPS